jgi:hypothetical protein
VTDKQLTNEEKADKVEQFILDQAVAAGVVRKVVITPPKNPNKWGKTLAPWFSDKCRDAKKEMAKVRREHGKEDARSLLANKVYLKTCQQARLEFAKQTPDMLKYQPTRFWGMIKNKNVDSGEISAKTFAEYN